MRKVAHFVRKSTQLKASFIKGQITYHQSYTPFIVFRKKVTRLNDGGFADFDLNSYQYLDLSEGESPLEKISYKSIRTLSRRQIELVQDFIQRNHIDICHFHYGTDCGVFYPLTKQLTIPSVVSFYGHDCSSFPGFMLGHGKKYLMNRVFKRVTRVLAMSPDMKKDLIASGCPENKIMVHYYGSECKKFYHQRNYDDKERLIALMVASLVPQKGHLFLLKSIKRLIDSGFRDFELRIAGIGELETELKQFVRQNKLNDHVRFLGALKYASTEMMREYHDADIFVHPSVIARNGDKEGIPGTIVEAMSAGLPVVSTFHAGIPYIIENGVTGFLVKEWDVNALAKKIKLLMNNADLREKLGRSAQKFALENLALHVKEQELEDIYNSLLK